MPMRRNSSWVMLILAIVLVGVATLRTASTVSAHQALPAHATSHHVALQWVGACKPGYHLSIYMGGNGPTEFGNYDPSCVQGDQCATVGTYNPASMVCLYQDANYLGQEIDFAGNGCANLTDFAGPGPGGTWNDAMSSFRIFPGSSTSGAFWWDTNDKGYYYLFGPSGSGRVSSTSYIGSTWNDQASSILLDPNPDTNVC